MSIKPLLDDLSQSASDIDATDLPSLVSIQDMLIAVRAEVEPDHAPVGSVVEQANDIIEQIILRELDDTQAAVQYIADTIEYLGKIVDSVEQGNADTTVDPPSYGIPTAQPDGATQDTASAPSSELEAPTPTAEVDTAPADDIDTELVSAWVSQCDYTFPELEAIIVSLDSNADIGEALADVRRRVHTIKGECGILSLDDASKLCHEAESAIDRCLEHNHPFPVDDLLNLLDWLKKYVQQYADDPTRHHPSPEHSDLLQVFKNYATADIPQATQERPENDSPSAVNYVPDTDASEPVVFDEKLLTDDNLGEFIPEARDHITNAEAALLHLEDNTQTAELINSVFRAFHTIKGCAGFLSFASIVQIAHSAETMLDEIRKGTLQLSTECINLSLEACDMMSKLLDGLEGQGSPPTKGELAHLVAMLAHVTDGGTLTSKTPDRPERIMPLGVILCELGLATEEHIEEVLANKESQAAKLRVLLDEAGLENTDAIENALAAGSDEGNAFRDMVLKLELIDPQRLDDAIEAKRNSGKRIGQLLGLDSDTLVSVLREQRNQQRDATDGKIPATVKAVGISPQPTNTPPQTPTPSAPTPAAAPINNTSKSRANQTVKVNTARMDGLVDMVGELVIAQQMVVQDESIQNLTGQRTRRNLAQVGKIIRDLQEVAMSLRMVTVKSTFQRMARLVRDLSMKSGKKISFVIEGEDTELDRNVVEEIADPLVHMIRNACDHGLEAPDERSSAGKSQAGTLTLRAFHQGGSIVIEVEDDGRGLNRDRILNKAIEKGLISADKDVSEIPDSEVYNMVFMPGFSTAKEVTDVSGRGVGMDVVRRNIESLRGKAEIRSEPGKGSTFVMRLPLTMAIIDGMIVRVGSQRYVIPTLAIEQSYRPTKEEIHSVVGRGEMARVRGSLLPIYRLNKVFGLSEGLDDLQEALLLVLEVNDSRCALVVDEILGQQQVVIKSLGQGINSIRGVSGGAILGDGRVAPIIDVIGLVSEATKQHAV